MSNTFACDQCQKRYKLDPRLAGKQVKCKSCGHIMLVPSDGAPPPVAPVPPAAKPARPAAPPQRPADACPGCGQPLAAQAKICVNCGFNRFTGKRMDVKVSATTPPAPSRAAAAAPARAGAEPRFQAAGPADAGGIRPNLPYAIPHLALLDQWATILFFILGLAVINFPWLYFLYRCLDLPPLPPGYWKPLAVQLLVYMGCSALMFGAWVVTYLVVKTAAKALKFELAEGAFKRVVAASAIPVIVWGVSYHLMYKSAMDVIYHPAAVVRPGPTPGPFRGPPTAPPPMQNLDDQMLSALTSSALEASAIAVVLAAGFYFFFYRLKKLDFVFCALISCVLFFGTLVGESFLARVLNNSVVKSVQKSAQDDLKALPKEDAAAYQAKLQDYLKSHPDTLNKLFDSAAQTPGQDWQLP